MLYTIQKGDTLSALAKRYKTSVKELAKRNNIANVNKIYTGAKLDIPESVQTPEAPAMAEIKWSAPDDVHYAAPQETSGFAYSAAPYKSEYSEEIEALIKELDEREDFKYDPSDDPVFDNYRESYIRGGELAMRDSMGEAAALTGGYGSSYAQNVGQ